PPPATLARPQWHRLAFEQLAHQRLLTQAAYSHR
ncbi:hypothetical protein ECEC1850_4854, partial [Escherichia coli EC1850]